MDAHARGEATPDTVFKIAYPADWRRAVATGAFAGAADDLRDGYIHLSAADQVSGTLSRHFKGASELLLIAFEAKALGERLRWERSRGGDMFPHYYGNLPPSRAKWVKSLTIGADGVLAVDPDLLTC
jgi:uncharacterized protein (DUF952 family)